jgi:glucose/arabinose dehydrogenase
MRRRHEVTKRSTFGVDRYPGPKLCAMWRPPAPRAVILVAALLTACSSSSSTSTRVALATPTPSPATTPTPTPASTAAPPPATPTPNACALGPQAPPGGTIAANFATALAFAPDGRLFYAERSGTIRVWQDGGSRVFATVATVTTEPDGSYSERGLLGLAISPTFTTDHLVYAFYSNTDYAHQTVVRWTDCAGTGQNATNIISLPSGGDCCHKGGRMAFGPDGKLYVTLGDEHTANAAQNGNDFRGKVLRYNPDGSVPGDNPFGPNDAVYAYGFRNPFGIAISSTGRIAVTNNGPTGDAGSPRTGYDTVDATVERGGGYQWPFCYGYSHPIAPYSGCGGQHGPDWSSEASTVVPAGATFVDASGPAGYANQLVFCTYYKGGFILGSGGVTAGPAACKLDIKQGTDHALYYSDAGHIYRLG